MSDLIAVVADDRQTAGLAPRVRVHVTDEADLFSAAANRLRGPRAGVESLLGSRDADA